MDSTEKTRITVQEVLDLLDKGYARTTSSSNYNSEIGSIEEHFGLNKTSVSELFKHPKLKGRKTKTAKEVPFVLIDEEEETANPSASNEEDVETREMPEPEEATL